MKYVEIGGRRAAAIGLGFWQFGTTQWGDLGEAEGSRIVQRALDLGINIFDTAETYGDGLSEELLSRSLGNRRNEAIIATKVHRLHLGYADVLAAAEGSRKRLGGEPIDIYQIHFPNVDVPIEETMRAMRKLVDDGVVRAIGVSNFSVDLWQRGEAALGLPIVSNQLQLNLLDQTPMLELVPHAQAEGRAVIAFSPLAQGALGGRYDASSLPQDFRAERRGFTTDLFQKVSPLLEALKEVGQRHQATPAQIALAWVIAQPSVIAIPGARTVEQLEQNAAAADIDLSPQEVAGLTEIGRGLGAAEDHSSSTPGPPRLFY
jgi:aryl-alcohol dehydrogenase-like predicted oxidoreductase